MTESTTMQTPKENHKASENYLEGLFAKAGKISKGFFTDEERAHYAFKTGVKRFKRKTLGICGSESVKSLDDLSDVLVDIGMAVSPEEARKALPQMVKAFSLIGGASYSPGMYIKIKEVKNSQGEVQYRIYTNGLRW